MVLTMILVGVELTTDCALINKRHFFNSQKPNVNVNVNVIVKIRLRIKTKISQGIRRNKSISGSERRKETSRKNKQQSQV